MQEEKAAVEAALAAMSKQAQEVADALEPRVGTAWRDSDIAALTQFIRFAADLSDAVDKLLEALDWEGAP